MAICKMSDHVHVQPDPTRYAFTLGAARRQAQPMVERSMRVSTVTPDSTCCAARQSGQSALVVLDLDGHEAPSRTTWYQPIAPDWSANRSVAATRASRMPGSENA